MAVASQSLQVLVGIAQDTKTISESLGGGAATRHPHQQSNRLAGFS